MGLSATIMLAVICTSMAAAISPQQAPYNGTIMWNKGNWLSYGFKFYNQYSPGENNNNSGNSIYYLPTLNINANFTYNITAINGNKINITETITNIVITDNMKNVASRTPFIAMYNSSVSMDAFLLDFENEVGANRDLNNSKFLIPSHYTSNKSITRNSTMLGKITNNVVFYTNNDTAVPQAINRTTGIINRFIVSSNISGLVSSYSPEYNESSPTTMKVLRFGMLYTPLAFAMAGQNGSFWMNQAWNESAINDFGLWGKNKISNQSMGFSDNETYSSDITGGNARWVGKFYAGYAKVGGYEQAFFDSYTGILMSYQTIQTRWDGYIGKTFYSGVQPQVISITLYSANSGIASELIKSNASTSVPGYPVVALLMALGIGFIIARRKSKH